MVKRYHITALRIAHFRKISQLDLKSIPICISLWGNNGSGKTSVLDVLSLLNPQYKSTTETIQWGQEAYHIVYTIHIEEMDVTDVTDVADVTDVTDVMCSNAIVQEVQITRTAEDNKVWINAQSDTSHIPILYFSVEDGGLFRNKPQKSLRDYINKVIGRYDSHFKEGLAIYEKLLHERFIALNKSNDERWFRSLEKEISLWGVRLTKIRGDFIERYNQYIAQLPFDFHAYVLRVQSALGGEEADTLFQSHLKQSRGKDKQFGGTSIGPSRDVISFINTHTQKDMIYGSTGEQKVALLALFGGILSMDIALKEYIPIVLMDEWGNHLDEIWQNRWMKLIKSTKAQWWVTGIHNGLYPFKNYALLAVHLREGARQEGARQKNDYLY